MFSKLRIPVIIVLVFMLMTLVVSAQETNVMIKKYISVDGGTWLDADLSPGPSVIVGTPIAFKFIVTNTGDGYLREFILEDTKLDLSGLDLEDELAPNESFERFYTNVFAKAGFRKNIASISAAQYVYSAAESVYYESPAYWVYDTDPAHYYGYQPLPGYNPSIMVKKYISVDGGLNWLDAETAPGPSVEAGKAVQFKYIVTNTGNVALTDLTLTDSDFDLSAAQKPAVLIPGGSFEYILTGKTAVLGQHENTAYATGTYLRTVYSDFDKAHYLGLKTDEPGISLKKYVSVDGGSTWHDAEAAPGPTTKVGDSARFKFVVSNTGNVTLTDIKLTDDTLDISGLTYPASLSSGSSFERILTGVEVEEGQHANIAKVTGKYERQTYSDTDKAHYMGVKTDVSAPAITVKKYVSVDKGLNWLDADTAPGPSAWVDAEVWFKFVVTNTGNVELTNLTLADNEYSLSGASIPASLDSGKSFEYILTGIKAKLGQQSNIATAIGKYGNQTVIDTDLAHYKGYRKDIPTPRTDGYGNVPLAFIIGTLLLTGGLILRKKWILR